MTKNEVNIAVNGLKLLQSTIEELIESNETIDCSELKFKFKQKALLRKILNCLEIAVLKNKIKKIIDTNKVSLDETLEIIAAKIQRL